jgi:hypothetical protein
LDRQAGVLPAGDLGLSPSDLAVVQARPEVPAIAEAAAAVGWLSAQLGSLLWTGYQKSR